jgi:hypothetical protein
MHRSMLGLATLLALGAAACGAGTDVEGGPIGTAAQRQLGTGYRDYLIYDVLQNSRQIGQVLVTATAYGTTYAADTEYWYMTANVSTSYDLVFTSGTPQYWSNPPSGLGTLSFSMDQRATWSSCGVRGSHFEYTEAGVPEYLIGWNMTESGGTWSGNIVWINRTESTVFGPNETNDGVYSTYAPSGWYCYTADPL